LKDEARKRNMGAISSCSSSGSPSEVGLSDFLTELALSKYSSSLTFSF